jgi:murein DD-endopeptidase MepM/ murein hydrolase activator NlpD
VRRLLLRALLLPALVLLVVLLPDVATAGPGLRTGSPSYGWPLAGSPLIDRGFEPPRTAWGAGHRGVDLRAPWGTPVLAAGAGRVTYAGLLAGRGVVVVAHAGGLRTTYEPVTALVQAGADVARGKVLGLLAAGHASCRPGLTCLHWGLLRGSTYLDPLALLDLGPARLLPLHPRVGAAAAVPASRTTRSASGGAGLRTDRTLRAPAPPATPHGRVAGRVGAVGAALSVAAGAWGVARRRRP